MVTEDYSKVYTVEVLRDMADAQNNRPFWDIVWVEPVADRRQTPADRLTWAIASFRTFVRASTLFEEQDESFRLTTPTV